MSIYILEKKRKKKEPTTFEPNEPKPDLNRRRIVSEKLYHQAELSDWRQFANNLSSRVRLVSECPSTQCESAWLALAHDTSKQRTIHRRRKGATALFAALLAGVAQTRRNNGKSKCRVDIHEGPRSRRKPCLRFLVLAIPPDQQSLRSTSSRCRSPGRSRVRGGR